jgi:hypothetical protein
MSIETPLVLEQAPPTPAPPVLPPGARLINERVIIRETRGGVVRWLELQPQLPTRVNGVLVPRPDRYVCVAADDPADTLRSIDFRGEPLNPRTVSPIHDQLRRAREAGFTELAEAFELGA